MKIKRILSRKKSEAIESFRISLPPIRGINENT